MANYPNRPDIPTCDVCDALGMDAQCITTPFHNFGGVDSFSGPVVTVQTYNDNRLIKSILDEDGLGRVLLVDNSGDNSCALIGGNLAAKAARNGWAALIIHGYIRDRHELICEAVAVKALGAIPRKSAPQDRAAERGGALTLDGVVINSGDWITGDLDGLVVTAAPPLL